MASAVKDITKLKTRATSKSRVTGFEPVKENTQDYNVDVLLPNESSTKSIHRESRKRAVRREKHTGVR